MKKNFIITKRKEQFSEKLKELEQTKPEMKLTNVLEGLDDREREKALNLYNKMIICIISGKYSFKDYYTFMKGLPDVVKGKSIFLSDDSQRRIAKSIIPRKTSTFSIPSKKSIAGICPKYYDTRSEENMQRYRDRIIDINHGNSFLSLRQLGELGDNEKVRYYDSDREDKKVKAIGKLGQFIVCTGANEELTFVPEERKRQFEVNGRDESYDER